MTETHGDRDLAERVGERLGERHPVFAVATIAPGETRVAAVGAGLTASPTSPGARCALAPLGSR